MTRATTVVLNWNGGEDTAECLDSLTGVVTDGWSHRILVVDNGSTDGSIEGIERCFPGVDVVRNGLNLGFTGGVNRGIEEAVRGGADYVVLLNNDTVVEPDSIGKLISHAEAQGGEAIVTPVIRTLGEGEIWYAGIRLIRPFGRPESIRAVRGPDPYPVEIFTGCCVVLPVAVLERIGRFDDRYFAYYEDVDLSVRAAAAGVRCWVVPAALVHHKVSRVFGSARAPHSLYYTVRNNLLFIRERSAGFPERLAGSLYMVVLSVKMIFNVLVRPHGSRMDSVRAIAQGWGDFIRRRWGKRA